MLDPMDPKLDPSKHKLKKLQQQLQYQLTEGGRLAQLVRASALQAEGHPFEADTAHQQEQ